MSSVPLRARSPFFSFDAETGARRPRWAAFVAGLVAVLLALAGSVVGVTAASAHDKGYDVSCFGLRVVLTNYNTSHPNTVSVVIDGVERVPDAKRLDFGANYTFQTTWDPSVDHTYAIVVDGWDGYDLEVKPTTQKACAKPGVGLTATECNTTGGATTLTGTVSGFASYASPKPGYPSFAPTYTASLVRGDGVTVSVPNAQNDSDGKIVWSNQAAGYTYTLVVTADGAQNAGLTASVVATAIACPELKDFSASANQCDSPTGDNSSISVNATVTPGRAYTVALTHNGAVIQTQNVAASNSSPSVSLTFPVAENLQNLQVVMTDTAAAAGDPNRERMSNILASTPCPKFATFTVDPSVCSVVGGTLTLTVDIDNLVPGRSYTVAIDSVVVETLTSVSSSSVADKVYPVSAGSHVVTVTDLHAPSATTSSEPVTVAACPTLPSVAISVVECSAPGGDAVITATFGSLSVGRGYEVAITEDGDAMGAYPVATIDSTTSSKQFANLTPGSVYTVTVTDTGAPGVKGAASQTLKPCPDSPTISVTTQCELISNTTYYGVNLDKLQAGEQYVVTITNDNGDDAATPVTVTGGAGGLAPTFQAPNGQFYTIAVTQLTNAAITASTDVYATVCDLPTFPLPPELPTLALTGAADTTMPMLGALGLVQFGVALLALAAMLRFAPGRRRA